jgi:MbtH protein
MIDRELDRRTYVVVLNHEEQYSIWFADRPLPAGWSATGVEGTKDDCLRHIEQVWTDMTPLSVRRHIDRMASPS